MKTIVRLDDLSEPDIKPDALFEEFARLTARDVAERLVPQAMLETPCPGCAADAGEPAFAKLGLHYRSCRHCGTLFVSPRPPQEALDRYYRDAGAARYWREAVLPATAAARTAKLQRPRAEWIVDGLAEHAPDAVVGLDLTPYGAALVATLIALSRDGAHPLRRIIAAHSAADRDAWDVSTGVAVSPRPTGQLADLGPVDLVMAFDVLERVASPAAVVAAAREVLRPGGLLFVSATSIDGFDLQVLWERSRAIAPPEKLNLLSIEALRGLFPAEEWTVHELSTPGLFDAEAVRRAIAADPAGDWPRVVRGLVRDPATTAAVQELLQRQRLSSFARLLVQRRS